MEEYLQRLGFDSLNQMQQDAIKAFQTSDNMVLLSPTGSGKTLAYLLPLLKTIEATNPIVQA